MLELDFSKAKELIFGAKNILLAAHAYPDADALGSILALGLALERSGSSTALPQQSSGQVGASKRVQIFCAPSVPAHLKFIAGDIVLTQKPDYADLDLIIGADYGSFGRLFLDEAALAGVPIVTFDHHIFSDQRGLLLIDQGACSTCEIIYNFFNFCELTIDNILATYLLAGICEDTGGFRHKSAGLKVLEIAGDLLTRGAAYNKIVKNLAKDNVADVFDAWALGMRRAIFDHETGVISSFVSCRDFPQAAAVLENFSGFSHLLSTVPQAKMSVFLVEKTSGVIKASLRTQEEKGVDASRIARAFGGSGLKLAAGFETTESSGYIISKIKDLMSVEV